MTTPDQDTTAQRSATRAPVGKPIKLQFDDSMDVVEGLCENVSIGGMFIQVANTRPQGSLVRFELQLDDSTAVRGLGEVVWMRAKSAGAGRSAGIGIKFRFLEQRDRQLIFKLVSQHIKDRLASRQSQGDAASRPAPSPGASEAVPAPPLPPAAPPKPSPPAAAPALSEPRSWPAAPLVTSEVPPELLADEPAAASGGPGEPAAPQPAAPEPSIPQPPIRQPSIPQPPIREPETAAAEVLEPEVDDWEIPELLMVPEEEEEPEVELVEDFDTELEGLEAAPALVESVPDLPGSESKDEETLSELTLTPRLEEEISYDEMMGRDVTGTGTPDFGVPDVGAWDAGMPEPGMPEPGTPAAGTPAAGTPAAGMPDVGAWDAGTPDHGVPDLGLSDPGGWETVGEGGVELAGEGLPEEDFGPSRRRSPLFLVLAAVLVAVLVAAYFFRDDLFAGRSAPAARAADPAPREVAAVEGAAEVPPGSEPTGSPDRATPPVVEPIDEAPAPAGEPVTSPTAGEPPSETAAQPTAAPPAVPPPAAPAAAPFTRVTDISWGPLAGGQRVVIAADGSVPEGRFKYSRLDSPPRELIKLYGVSQPFPKTALVVGGPAVERIRLGYHPGNELHIVLDLADPRVRIREVRSVGSRLVVELEIP